MSKKDDAIKWLLNEIDKINPGNPNVQMYEEMFKKMSNKEFEQYMDDLESGKETLTYTEPNLSESKFDVETVMTLGEKLGIDWTPRLIEVDSDTGVEYMTPVKYLVVDLPVRRQSQHQKIKQSFQETDTSVDALTGQVTGKSKTGRMTLPESMILNSIGLNVILLEALKVDGGDSDAYREAKIKMLEEGEYSLKEIMDMGTKPTSVDVYDAYLYGMGIDANFRQRKE